MKLLFILNPVAGKGKSVGLLSTIKNICQREKVEYMIKMTPNISGGMSLARWGVDNGYEKIIAVGGDGTVHEVVNGIVGSKAVLGVIPGGSGNDFVRSLGAFKEIDEYLLDIIYGNIKAIDLGLCNNTYFINVASVGLDAQVVIGTEKAKRLFSGSAAYLVSALFTILSYKGWNMKIEIDGKTFQGRTLLAAIANGMYYGGGALPAPYAKLDDGYFDFCHIEHMTKHKMFNLLPKYMKGQHNGISEIRTFKGKDVRITCSTSFPLNLDGEITMANRAHFKMIQKGINIIYPR